MQLLYESKRKRRAAVKRMPALLVLRARPRPRLQLSDKGAVGTVQGGGLTEVEEGENLLGEEGRGLEKRHG